MSVRLSRPMAGVVGAVCAGLMLSGCKFDGAYDLPLPGHPVDKHHSFLVTAEFRDILSVVPRSPVKVDDVTVGEVTDVERTGWNAKITMRVRDDVKLPDNAIADIRQVSLLGEKYVALEPPVQQPAAGRLGDGDNIALSDTGRNPEVEEVLGALSYLLSGGGVEQIKVISDELNKVMTGRQDRLRHLLSGLDTLVGTLDDQKHDIISALSSINDLTATLNREKGTITAALDTLGPAVDVLRSQHKQLITMLRQLDKLGVVGTRVIGRTKDNLIADLQHLRPILSKLNAAGESLPRGLSLLLSFPFPVGTNVVKGDYANTSIALDVDLSNLLSFYGLPNKPLPLPSLPNLPTTPKTPTTPKLPKLPKLPKTPSLPKVPKLPTLPGLPGQSGGSGNSSGNSSGSGSGSGSGGLPGILGEGM